MRGVNKVILVGTLGKDVEVKTFPNGGSLAQFSIATSESWTDKNTGERKEQTEWHRIVLSNRLGEIAAQYLRKGSKVYIEGSLRTRQWTDQGGQERYTTEIRGEHMQMLDSNQNGNNQGNNNQGGYSNQNQGGYSNKPQQQGYSNKPQQQGTPQGGYGNNQNMHQPQPPNGGGGTSDLDDDLPFAQLDWRLG